MYVFKDDGKNTFFFQFFWKNLGPLQMLSIFIFFTLGLRSAEYDHMLYIGRGGLLHFFSSSKGCKGVSLLAQMGNQT